MGNFGREHQYTSGIVLLRRVGGHQQARKRWFRAFSYTCISLSPPFSGVVYIKERTILWTIQLALELRDLMQSVETFRSPKYANNMPPKAKIEHTQQASIP